MSAKEKRQVAFAETLLKLCFGTIGGLTVVALFYAGITDAALDWRDLVVMWSPFTGLAGVAVAFMLKNQ